MSNIAAQEPQSFYAGDTVSWQISLSDYKASQGWELRYYLSGPASFNFAASAENDDFLVTLSAVATANYTAGSYAWIARVSKDGEVYTVNSGTMEIKQNIATLTGAQDHRSHVRVVLDALEAMIANKATHDQQSYSIAGRSLTRMTPEELLKWRNVYKTEYANELKAARIARGEDSGSIIRVRLG